MSGWDLTGKVAIVTGGSRGIGKAIALRLSEAGATVVVNYRTQADAAQAVAEACGGHAVQADVSTPQGCKDLVAYAEGLGGVHVLVNNAGITRDMLMLRMDDAEWREVIATNLDGTFFMCRAAAQVMLRQRAGSIINITSVSGLRGNPGQANYSASKAAVAGMTRSLAKELAKRQIRVNCVAPGFIETDMVAAMDPRVVDGAKKLIPMRRLGQPAEVAQAVLFLASDAAAYITGHELVVDGGMTS